MAALRPPARALNSAAFSYACGVIMVLGASVSFAAAHARVLVGLAPDDMIFARYVVAGFVTLPLLLYWGIWSLAGIGWPHGLALLTTGRGSQSGLAAVHHLGCSDGIWS